MNEEIFDTAALLAAYQEVFQKTDAGKKVLKDLFRKGFIGESTMDASPHVTAFNEGRRAIILEILQILETDVEEFLASQYI